MSRSAPTPRLAAPGAAAGGHARWDDTTGTGRVSAEPDPSGQPARADSTLGHSWHRLVHRARTSLRYRLVLMILATIVVSTVLASLLTYQAARVSLYHQLDLELTTIADQTAQQLAVDLSQASAVSTDSLQAENVAVMVVGANRDVSNLLGDAATDLTVGSTEIAVARIQTGSSARNGLGPGGVPFRIVAVPFTAADTGKAYALVIGRELGPTADGLAALSILQWIIGLATVAVAALAAFFVPRAVLEPINRLTEQVGAMTESDELAPIQIHGESEMADLERSFNSLIRSLSTSRDRQEQLIADASHELRTPLTSLKTNIELLIADDKTQMLPAGARGEILRDVDAQVGEFSSLVGDLVALSRDDLPVTNLAEVDFAAVVERAVVRARRRGPTLLFDVNLQPTYVRGDALMLERAVTNLLDNAVKFSPAHGAIVVRLGDDGLTIADQGPGISDVDIPHVFDRFYRSDSARNTPGTGLGLSIVAHTVTAHGGSVEAGRAAGGGALFTVRLPTIDPEDD